MEIVVNGAPRQVESATSLRQLLESLQLPALERGIAVCVNGELVRRADWPARALKARDEIEIVQATQGG
jgi:sulfur carrier protein